MTKTPKSILKLKRFLLWKEKNWNRRFKRGTRLLIIGAFLFLTGVLIGKIYTDSQIQHQFRIER